MKPKMTDSVSCDQLLCSFESRITLFEITINQWRDDTLTCCLSVNWNTSLNNESPVHSVGVGNQIIQGEEPAKKQKSQTPLTQRLIGHDTYLPDGI